MAIIIQPLSGLQSKKNEFDLLHSLSKTEFDINNYQHPTNKTPTLFLLVVGKSGSN